MQINQQSVFIQHAIFYHRFQNQAKLNNQDANQVFMQHLRQHQINENKLSELVQLIQACSQDSQIVLQIEQNLKNLFDILPSPNGAEVLYMLCLIFCEGQQNSFIAGILLKNFLKNFYTQLQQHHLNLLLEIEYTLFINIAKFSQNHATLNNQDCKLFQLLCEIVGEICKKHFFEDDNLQNNQFLLSVFQLFTSNANYNPILIETVIVLFEKMDDDRMSQFVGHLLPHANLLLSTQFIFQNRLLFFIVLLFKSALWAIGVDPQVIKNNFQAEIVVSIHKHAQFIFQQNYNEFYFYNFQLIRLSSQILTIIERDFSEVLGDDTKKNLMVASLVQLSNIQPQFENFFNLITRQKFEEEVDNIFTGKNLAFGGREDEEYQTFEQELKSCVAQIMNLMQTVMGSEMGSSFDLMKFIATNFKQRYFIFSNLLQDPTTLKDKELAGLGAKIITLILLSFCKFSAGDISLVSGNSQSEWSSGDLKTDMNTFLVSFLETDEDQLNLVSIRLSVTEFLDELLQDQSLTKINMNGKKGFDNLLHLVVLQLYEGQDVKEMIKVQQQEIALFIIGEFKDKLLKQSEKFLQVLIQKDLNDPQTHTLLKMRILWLLERLSLQQEFKGDANIIFEQLVTLFSLSDNIFPVKYQCLRTMYRYAKQIDLKNKYGDTLPQILLSILINLVQNILPFSNEDTVHIPIQALTFFAKIQPQNLQLLFQQVPGFISEVRNLFDKYYQDGMLCEDILELSVVLSETQDLFQQVFLPKIQKCIGVFYAGVQQTGISQLQLTKIQEEAQINIDQNLPRILLQILNSYLNARYEKHNFQSQEEAQQILQIYMQVCEILHATRDTYLGLHFLMTLAVFIKRVFVKDLTNYKSTLPQLSVLLGKLSNEQVGMSEAASAYLGHTVYLYLEFCFSNGASLNDFLEGQQRQLIINIAERISKKKLQSFISEPQATLTLPLHLIIQINASASIQMFQQLMPQQFVSLLEHLLQSMRCFSNKNSKKAKQSKSGHIYTMGCLALLDLSVQDLQFAGINTQENIPIQTQLVNDLSQQLVLLQDQPTNKKEKNKQPEDEYGMYGDDYGDYGNEYGSFDGMDIYGEEDDQNLNFDKSSGMFEDYLFLEIQLDELKKSIVTSLKKVGSKTIKMILQQTKSSNLPESKQFSEQQISLINEIFS